MPPADDALNYGGIGAVIGHEMTHGFDDEGSQYDAQGNLRDWWTPEDLKNFKERAACVEKQFDGFTVADDLHENGKLVLGESIADLGGLTIAHMAFERALAAKPAAAQRSTALRPSSASFSAFARIWATTARPEYERMLVTVDPHPAAALSRKWRAHEHAGVCRSVLLPGRRPHGSPRRRGAAKSGSVLSSCTNTVAWRFQLRLAVRPRIRPHLRRLQEFKQRVRD